MIAFYPIKPMYSERILVGEKKYELRRRLPSRALTYMLIYSTNPVGKVVGYAKVKKVHKNSIYEIWNMVSSCAGITKIAYETYFKGCDEACALELEDIRRFVRPFCVKEISADFMAPQSFCYVDEAVFKRVSRRKTKAV